MERVPAIEVRVLGPLSLHLAGEVVEVAGPRQRGLLALLALAEGRTVTVDQLLAALWPAVPPDDARRALHTNVSRLRGQLGSAATRLATRPDGYQLALTVEELDLSRARSLLAAARRELATDPRRALSSLQEARALWRGPMLSDLDGILTITSAVAEAAHLHRTIVDLLVESAIRAGRPAEVVEIAAEAVRAEPLREPAVLLQMRALAAAGRSAEALDAARDLRRRLADEAGLDPSPALDDLQRLIAAGGMGRRPAEVRVERPITPVLGRDAELAQVRDLLGRERLVTVSGPGGIGKTTLTTAAVQGRRDALMLSLAAIRDPVAVVPALATALELQGPQGGSLEACTAILADRVTLLVLDNCEHLLEVVRDTVDRLLATCAGVRILTTSREPLGLPIEVVVRLGPLALPEPGSDPRASAAVAVFLDRAARARPGLEPAPDVLDAAAEIARSLGGMPLALELAAGRLSTFSVEELLARLDPPLDLLAGGRPTHAARHRTMRATMQWSYDLLAPDERRLLRCLAVFVDGVMLEAAESVALALGIEDDPSRSLAHLVDASLLEPEFGPAGTRYRMLEVIRAFALDRLVAEGEYDLAETALIDWAVDLVSWAESALLSENEPTADQVVRRELSNLRAAWRAVRDRGDLDAAAHIAAGLFDVVAYRDLVELRWWVAELADDPSLLEHPRAAAVLGTAAEAAYHAGEHDLAGILSTRGLARGAATADRWYCHIARAVVALARGDVETTIAQATAAASAAPQRGDPRGLIALAMAYDGDLEGARRSNDAGVGGARSPTMHSWHAYVAAEIESLAGDRAAAEERYLRAIELAATSGATFLVGIATVGLVAVRGRGSRPSEALSGYREALDYFAGTGNWTHLWATLRNLADLLRRLGDEQTALALEDAADAAPDAPAVVGADDAGRCEAPVAPLDRSAALVVARDAIGRYLGR